MSAVPTIEGAYSIEKYNGMDLVHQYYDLGVRAIALVWNPENALGAGTTGPVDMGSTELSVHFVKVRILQGKSPVKQLYSIFNRLIFL